MKYRDLLANWGLGGLKINAGFLEAEFVPQDEDRMAAWELYIELQTRITTQSLGEKGGVSSSALSSMYSLYSTTRGVLKKRGPGCYRCAKIALVVLNQELRPFLSEWHPLIEAGREMDPGMDARFRSDLKKVQESLDGYSGLLLDMSGVNAKGL